jgi:hypothetical protein
MGMSRQYLGLERKNRRVMNFRSTVTGLLVLAFIASHNLYLYCINLGLLEYGENVPVDEEKVWYSSEFILFIIPLVLMGNSNKKCKRENQFRLVGYSAATITMALIVYNEIFILPNASTYVYAFNGLTFAVTLYALLFSDENGNF